MATVTKKFRDDFETWAAYRMTSGEWTKSELSDFKEMLRKDLAPGPDQLRSGLSVNIGDVEIPASIDDCKERYRLWADYFANEAEVIRATSG